MRKNDPCNILNILDTKIFSKKGVAKDEGIWDLGNLT